LKIIGIQSSPNTDGLTSTLAQAILEGAKSEGATIELIQLNKLNIRACEAHSHGWGTCNRDGKCIIKDDFEDLRKKVNEADALVFSTPVYFSDISESAKCFLDRLRRCEIFKRSISPLKGKPVIGIAAAGGSGGGAARALYNLETYLRFFGFVIFDLVPVTRISRKHKIEMLRRIGARIVTEDLPKSNFTIRKSAHPTPKKL
jgi:multimeric flavodoxin WrbA